MHWLFLLTLLWSVACSGSGPRAPAPTFIVNGQATQDYAAVGLLEVRSDDSIITTCTATLIGSRTLLTAAHCFDPQLAATKAQLIINQLAREVDFNSVLLHPGYVSPYGAAPDANPVADLALARLSTAIDIDPLKLSQHVPATGDEVTVIGFGVSAQTATGIPIGEIDGTKRSALSEVSTVDCELIGDVTDEAKGEALGHICTGDSGSPLLWQDEQGVVRVVGVASSGTPGCTQGFYIRTDKYLGWINEHVTNDTSVERLTPPLFDAQCQALAVQDAGALPDQQSQLSGSNGCQLQGDCAVTQGFGWLVIGWLMRRYRHKKGPLTAS